MAGFGIESTLELSNLDPLAQKRALLTTNTESFLHANNINSVWSFHLCFPCAVPGWVNRISGSCFGLHVAKDFVSNLGGSKVG